MTHLSVSLLGTFAVHRDGSSVSLGSRRTEALFAYLVRTGTIHPRDHLVELLWGDPHAARTSGNLRVLLTNLRKTVGDYLEITRTTAAFVPPPASRAEVDVHLFIARSDHALREQQATGRPGITALNAALSAWGGEFLTQFDLPDTAAFNDWVRRERDLLGARRISLLTQVVDAELAAGVLPDALTHAMALVELTPYDESAHQQLIRTLLSAGDMDGAVAAFERLECLLGEEFGSDPSPGTRALFAGTPRSQLIATPAGAATPAPERMPWSVPVTRPELRPLLDSYAEVRRGSGRVVFVRGSAGTGKTVLLRQAARTLVEHHRDLVVLGASCVDRAGTGEDPLLPETLLGQLAGDGAASWLEGRMPTVLVERLRRLSPAVLPDLSTGAPGPAVVAGLRSYAVDTPVLLVLDDFQWAAPATVTLLAALASGIHQHRIMAMVGLRSEHLPAATGGGRDDAVSWLLHRLRRTGQGSVVDLDVDHAAARQLLTDLIDSEPHDLPSVVLDDLLTWSGGNLLVAVDLLRSLVRHGQISQVRGRMLMHGTGSHWQAVPKRTRFMFEEMLSMVPDDLWPVLNAAAVLGTEFDAVDVVAQCGRAPAQVMDDLGRRLGRGLRLVSPNGPGTWYRFRQPLLREHLNGGLDLVERQPRTDLTTIGR